MVVMGVVLRDRLPRSLAVIIALGLSRLSFRGRSPLLPSRAPIYFTAPFPATGWGYGGEAHRSLIAFWVLWRWRCRKSL